MEHQSVSSNKLLAQSELTRLGDAVLAETEARLAGLLAEYPLDNSERQPQFMRVIDLLHTARTTWQDKRFDDAAHLRQWRSVRRQTQTQERIAQSLKSIGQLLANAAVELAACRPLLRGNPESVETGLTSLETELRAGLDELRWILSDLQTPPLLLELGLAASIARYAQRFSDHFGVSLTVSLPESLPPLPATVELAIFRIIQEALRNIARHAQASDAVLSLEDGEQAWTIRISNNGRGFVPRELHEVRGLVDRQEWAEVLQSHLQIVSAPGQGTSLTLCVSVTG